MPFRLQPPFKLDPQNTSIPPSQKHVSAWLWQINNSASPLVKKHGQSMLDKYFESTDAAELFALNGKHLEILAK